MEWALSLAKTEKKVSVNTGNYQTYPVLHKNEHKGWRGQQDLELEGEDTRRISDLVGKLQERLQVKTIRFSVSDKKRHAVENRLISEALDAFRERAGIIGENLQANSFRIVDINVDTATRRPPVPYQARMSSMAMKEDVPVAVEAGESQVTVTVSGTIELQLP
jgi:predicted secreted protein